MAQSEPSHHRRNHHGDHRRNDEDPNGDCEGSARESHAKLRRCQPVTDRVEAILGSSLEGIQGAVVQSDKRWLSCRGVQRKTAAEACHPLQATALNRIILRVKQAISNHIGHFPEGLDIETTRCQRGGAEA